jgi:hypothetical protein
MGLINAADLVVPVMTLNLLDSALTRISRILQIKSQNPLKQSSFEPLSGNKEGLALERWPSVTRMRGGHGPLLLVTLLLVS